jgi:glutamyl/glutaminyl-tRNA synthetase
MRRGIQVQTLKEFMLAQGPSKSTVLMEWDKIFALNKEIVDPTAKRLFAVSTERGVPVHIEEMSESDTQEILVDWHPKNKELGQRKQIRSNSLLIEYDDSKDLVEGQKLTIKGWGNTIVTKVEKEGDNVSRVFVKLNLQDTVFKNSKIVHWVPTGENRVRKKYLKIYIVYFTLLFLISVLKSFLSNSAIL